MTGGESSLSQSGFGTIINISTCPKLSVRKHRSKGTAVDIKACSDIDRTNRTCTNDEVTELVVYTTDEAVAPKLTYMSPDETSAIPADIQHTLEMRSCSAG